MWALKVTRSTMAATSLGSGTRFPFAERQVCPDGDGGVFFSFGDDLEQQLSPASHVRNAPDRRNRSR
jgi:hypothetical protein